MITFTEFYQNILTEEFLCEDTFMTKRANNIFGENIINLIWDNIIEKTKGMPNNLPKSINDISSTQVIFLQKSNLDMYENYFKYKSNLLPCLMVLIEKNGNIKIDNENDPNEDPEIKAGVPNLKPNTYTKINTETYNLLYYFVEEVGKNKEKQLYKYTLISSSESNIPIYQQLKASPDKLKNKLSDNKTKNYFKNTDIFNKEEQHEYTDKILYKLFTKSNSVGIILFPYQKNKEMNEKIYYRLYQSDFINKETNKEE